MEENLNDDWKSWSRYVLKELENLSDENKELKSEVAKISIELSQLQVKAGLWGGLAGAIPIIIVLLLKLLK